MVRLPRLFGRRNEVPLGDDEAGRFLPWIIGSMVFLAALAVASALTIAAASNRWNAELAGSATVQIAPASTEKSAPDTKPEARMQAALTVLNATDGVLAARPVSDDAARALVSPWLGTGDLGDIAMPQLIELTIDQDHLDAKALQARLTAAVPGAEFDDHRRWVNALGDLARSLQAVALSVLALVCGVAVLAIVFATRSGLAVHGEIVEVLHLIGARDDYIASGFARYASVLALRGGVGGTVVAAGALFSLRLAGADFVSGLLPSLTLSPYAWVIIACLPIAAALLAALTAHLTVLAALARLA
jgi:cell division transport system permease protein